MAAVWSGVYLHILYLGGMVGPWGYLAVAAAAAAILFMPGGGQREGLEALEFLYRWRRVCIAAAPLRALATAAMLALTVLSVAMFLHPPRLVYVEVAGEGAVGNSTFYTLRVVRMVPSGEWDGTFTIVLIRDGIVYMPFLWETAAFLAVAAGYTVATATLTALWRAVGSSAEGVRRALEFYERARRLLT